MKPHLLQLRQPTPQPPLGDKLLWVERRVISRIPDRGGVVDSVGGDGEGGAGVEGVVGNL